MTVHTIEIKPPSWHTATTIYLEVLRTNEWYSDAGKSARKWLYELADFMDVINEEHFLTSDDAQYLLDKVRNNEGEKE
jgi:hypothetical protein|tara:strand:+ start:2131 stop:2364 length:234 start_codon:yes stop_codon:yes gene_type:complete